jgi:hypothetical protein
MKAAGIELEKVGEGDHPTLASIDVGGRLSVAFVREPLTWYGSFWNHRRRKFESPDVPIDEPHLPLDNWSDRSFRDFLEAVIEEAPGYLSTFYSQLLGPRDNQVKFVGYFENLVDDLVRALNEAGESFDEDALRAFPQLNQTRDTPSCEDDLRLRLMRAEREVYERFYTNAPATIPR